MPSWSLLLVFGVLEAALVFFCVRQNAPRIESKLSQASNQALTSRNIDLHGGLVIDGRDVWLTGLVGDEETKTQAGRVVAGIEGARVVHNLLTVREEPAAAAPPPEPEAAAVQAQRALDELVAGRSVEFETASDRLTQRGSALVDQAAELLARFPDVRVEIAGHTDAEGPSEGNLDLSRRRADAVRSRVITRGIPQSRLSATGYGEDHPIADNGTAAGRIQNRRVEFTVR